VEMMKEKLECPICGLPTRVYMGNARKDKLCGKHADMLKAGEIYQKDEFFYDAKTNKVLNKDFKYTELPTEGFSNCVICNEKPKDTLFAKNVLNNTPKTSC